MERHEHLEAAGHPEPDRTPRGHTLIDQPGGHIIGAPIELRCSEPLVTVLGDDAIGVGNQPFPDRSMHRNRRRQRTGMG